MMKRNNNVVTPERQTEIEIALTNWMTLVSMLQHLNEEEILHLLVQEINTGPMARQSFLKRLHQRYGILRNEREWQEIQEMVEGHTPTR